MFSKLSIIFSVIGTVLMSSSYIYPNNFEILMISGLTLLIISLLLSSTALFKREQGKTKFLPVVAFFILSFIITWNEPFQIVRLLTWIKN
ncbi:hypothetical protein CSE16_07745 [Solibacillus sp. R5-41]|nr:hypothetical protein CSE16_07745 [Solibacillus sp. R5-41]